MLPYFSYAWKCPPEHIFEMPLSSFNPVLNNHFSLKPSAQLLRPPLLLRIKPKDS